MNDQNQADKQGIVSNSELIEPLGCAVCKSTGVIKYKEVDEFTSREWVPWKTEPCTNCCKVPSVEYPPYMPSCGAEMMQFYANFCDQCADPDEVLWNEKQEGSGCKFIIEATAESKQPEPWVIKGGCACCLNFRSP